MKQRKPHVVSISEDMSKPKMRGDYPKASAIEKAGHEIKENPPAVVKHTERKFGKKRARKQKIAIMLSKARKGE